MSRHYRKNDEIKLDKKKKHATKIFCTESSAREIKRKSEIWLLHSSETLCLPHFSMGKRCREKEGAETWGQNPRFHLLKSLPATWSIFIWRIWSLLSDSMYACKLEMRQLADHHHLFILPEVSLYSENEKIDIRPSWRVLYPIRTEMQQYKSKWVWWQRF